MSGWVGGRIGRRPKTPVGEKVEGGLKQGGFKDLSVGSRGTSTSYVHSVYTVYRDRKDYGVLRTDGALSRPDLPLPLEG